MAYITFLMLSCHQQNIIHFLAHQVEQEIEGGYSVPKWDQSINKHVQITQGPLKGCAGWVVAKNHIQGHFVVGLEFSGVKLNFKGSELIFVSLYPYLP